MKVDLEDLKRTLEEQIDALEGRKAELQHQVSNIEVVQELSEKVLDLEPSEKTVEATSPESGLENSGETLVESGEDYSWAFEGAEGSVAE